MRNIKLCKSNEHKKKAIVLDKERKKEKSGKRDLAYDVCRGLNERYSWSKKNVEEYRLVLCRGNLFDGFRASWWLSLSLVERAGCDAVLGSQIVGLKDCSLHVVIFIFVSLYHRL